MQNLEEFKKINRDSDPAYASFLKDKKVVIVGPAPHLIDSDSGSLIESYDVVVRLKKGFEVPEELEKDYGKRTDVLYSTLNNRKLYDIAISGLITTKHLLEKNVRWVCSANDKIDLGRELEADFIRQNKDRLPFHIVSDKYFEFLKTCMEKRFFTGTVAILDLICFHVKELFITGMTFCRAVDREKGIYYKEYKNPFYKPNASHDLNSQLDFFIELCKIDSRIKCDDILKGLLV